MPPTSINVQAEADQGDGPGNCSDDDGNQPFKANVGNREVLAVGPGEQGVADSECWQSP